MRRGTIEFCTINSSLHSVSEIPQRFAEAREQLLSAKLRKELHWGEISAPEQLSEHAVALAADVQPAGGADAGASGRIVLMYAPGHADTWGGDFRCVVYVKTPLEMSIALDPLITEVAWDWLCDSLRIADAAHSFLSGTVTKNVSQGFGSLRTGQDHALLELRASWTVTSGFREQAEAWGLVISHFAGLPVEEGVIPFQRGGFAGGGVRALGSGEAF